MILQVSHQRPLSGNKSKEGRNLDLIGFLSFFCLAMEGGELRERII